MTPSSKPLNIMLLVGEDTGRHMGCYGNPAANTPTLDKLAAEGCRYTRAFSTAPVCAPSRSALIMGKYAWTQGSHHMRSTLLQPPKLFTEYLRDAGIYVSWPTKLDFNFEPPASFADSREDWKEDLASGKLKDRPFFLYWNFGITHESTMWPEKWEENVKDLLAPEQRCDPAAVAVPAYLPDTPEVRADIARYHDSLQAQDMQVAEALDALDKSGQRDNTIVIYLTDHGRGLPREKRWCYDAGVHLPLIIRWPGVVQADTTCEELVSWVDIGPTILSLMGVPVPGDYQGRIFLGAEASEKPRKYCFAGRDRMDEAFDRIRIVRNERFHYIRNFYPQLPYCQRINYMEIQQTTQVLRELNARGQLNDDQKVWLQPTKPREELYDCLKDPDNVHNLAADPQYVAILSEMREALEKHQQCYPDIAVKSERKLIDEGLVKDRLEEYGSRIEPLPEEYRIGIERTVLEMPE